MPTPFGQTEEKKLLGAIKQAVDLIASGETPDSALAKIADDMQLHPDTVPLFVHAYNAGQQTHQRQKCAESGGGTSCLMEPHPIARIENVIGKLYPEKQAAESCCEDVDEEYSQEPRPLRAYEEEKTAEFSAVKLPCDRPPPRQRFRHEIHDILRVKSAAERESQRLDDILAESRAQMMSTLGQVYSYFKQAADRRISLAECEYNSRHMFGAGVRDVFDVVATGCKEARANGVVHSQLPVNAGAEPYSLVKAAMVAANQYIEDESIVNQTKAKIASEVATVDPFAEKKAGPSRLLTFDDLPPLASSETKRASFFEGAASAALGAMGGMHAAGPKAPGELVDDTTDKLTNPSHLAEMRRTNAQAMLADLIANDDVIRGFDPSEVTSAYNEITQLSPHTATQPAVIRGLLRRRLAGGALESHETHQISEINKNLQPQPPQPQQPKPAKKPAA